MYTAKRLAELMREKPAGGASLLSIVQVKAEPSGCLKDGRGVEGLASTNSLPSQRLSRQMSRLLQETGKDIVLVVGVVGY